jgi:hypothetical protein
MSLFKLVESLACGSSLNHLKPTLTEHSLKQIPFRFVVIDAEHGGFAIGRGLARQLVPDGRRVQL